MAQTLTPQQIAQYAYNAGFRGSALNQAVAIALAESGGNPTAYNPEAAAGTKTGSGSRGLWQIYGTAHPEFNNSQAFDPQVNANAAFKVFKEAGNRFTPWSTYNQGLARNIKDYASTIQKKSSVTTSIPARVQSSPVAVVARGSSAPVMAQGDNLGAAATATPSPVQSVASFLGVNTGPSKNLQDYIFIILGVFILLIGVSSLLVGGITGAYNAQGKLIAKNATKITGVL